MELRCRAKLHGIIVQPGVGGVVEFKCSSRFCGAGQGLVVLHRFKIDTGRYTTTHFKSPEREESNGTNHNPAAVRSA